MPPKAARVKPISLIRPGKKAATTPPPPQPKKNTDTSASPKVVSPPSAAARAGRMMLCYFLLPVLVIGTFIFPKPVLVQYRIGGNLLKNVYWDGLEKSPHGRLLDADYHAYLSEGRHELTLCSRYGQSKPTSHGACVTYRYEKTQGTVFALYHLFTQPGL